MHVFHRDLKPENILLFSEPDASSSSKFASKSEFRFIPKLADFGLASEEVRSEHFRIGTRAYASPECYGHPRTDYAPFDHCASDVWSLGMILYNMISALHPWPCPSISSASSA